MSHNRPSQDSAAKTTAASALKRLVQPSGKVINPLVMVETAFLASTSSLIWLINYYFPLGPLLRIFFPIPIALAYLRWGKRTAWMTTLVTGLLLSVLMGPPRSLQFLIPYGVLGIVLGGLWRRRVSWLVSMAWGTMVGSLGFFCQIMLVSLLLGENLWRYSTAQVTNLAEWLFVKLGLLAQPDLLIVQVIAAGMIVITTISYLLVVHLAAWLLLDRLGNPIPPPPVWLQVLLDHEEV
ncbi:MAG TPA: DUF2232 domain-containing protein [Candidatus Caenarcaniphilales bacterium]